MLFLGQLFHNAYPFLWNTLPAQHLTFACLTHMPHLGQGQISFPDLPNYVLAPFPPDLLSTLLHLRFRGAIGA